MLVSQSTLLCTGNLASLFALHIILQKIHHVYVSGDDELDHSTAIGEMMKINNNDTEKDSGDDDDSSDQDKADLNGERERERVCVCV